MTLRIRNQKRFKKGFLMAIMSVLSLGLLPQFGADQVLAASPTAPTLFHPADNGVVDDLNPILYAYYIDPDAADTGTTEYRVSSGTSGDCLSGSNIVDTGSSAATTSNNEVTQYTVTSALTDLATYNWCARNDDGTSTSAWTTMGSFTVYDTLTLLGSTYLGTISDDWGEAVGILPNGEIVAFTRVRDSAFPTTAGVIQDTDPSAGTRRHAAVTVFNESLTTLLRSTYVGGSDSDDYLRDGAVDDNGNIYITGTSYSSDLPQSGILTGFDTAPDTDCGDTFLLKLNSALTSITFSTYIGGTDLVAQAAFEECEVMGGGLAVHPTSGLVMVVSNTLSESLPVTANAFDTSGDGASNSYDSDMYVAFVDTTVSGAASKVFLSYVGDPFVGEWSYQEPYMDENEIGYFGIEVYGTFSQTTSGAYETTYPNTGTDTVFLKVDPYGTSVTSLAYASFIEESSPYALHTDSDGNIYILGDASGASLFVTPGTWDTTPSGSGDCFIYKIDPAGNGAADLLAATYVPVCDTMKIDDSNFVYFAGQTTDAAVPTSANAFRSAFIGGAPRSGYVGKLTSDLTTLDYGSYYGIQGTNGHAYFNGSALDGRGSYYVAGEVFPALTADPTIFSGDTTAGAYDTSQNDNRDFFVGRFVLPSDPIVSMAMGSPPSQITGLAAAAGNEEVTLTWDDPMDGSITDYEINYDETGSFVDDNPAPAVTIPAAGQEYTVTGLTNGTEYTFEVRAVNGVGSGAYSTEVASTPGTSSRRRGPGAINEAPNLYLGTEGGAIQEAVALYDAFLKGAASIGQSIDQAQELGGGLSELSEVVYQTVTGGEDTRNFFDDADLRSRLPEDKWNILRLLDLLTQLRRLYGFMQYDDYQLLRANAIQAEESRVDILRRNFLHLVGERYFAFESQFREALENQFLLPVDLEKGVGVRFGQVCYDKELIEYMKELDYPDSPNWFHRYKERGREWTREVLKEQAGIEEDFVDWYQLGDSIHDPLKAYYQYVFGFCLRDALER